MYSGNPVLLGHSVVIIVALQALSRLLIHLTWFVCVGRGVVLVDKNIPNLRYIPLNLLIWYLSVTCGELPEEALDELTSGISCELLFLIPPFL